MDDRGSTAARAGALAAALTVAAIVVLARAPVVLEPHDAAWRRLVRGPTADGVAYAGVPVLVAFPDLPRGRAGEVVLHGASLDAAPAVLAVSVDGAAPVSVALDARRAARVAFPAAPRAGLRIELSAVRGAPPARIEGVRIPGRWPPAGLLLAIAVAAAAVTALVARGEALDRKGAIAIACVAAAGAAAYYSVATGALSAGWLLAAAAVPVALLVAAAIVALPIGWRALVPAVLMVAAFTFGAAARWALAPAPGSWDMDYYRVWIETAVERGVTGVYGPPLEIGALDAALGRAGPLWAPTRGDRIFNIDYPPLAVAAWRAAVALAQPGEDAEWNVALKLPAMAGDVAAVLLLAFLWPGGRAGARAAAAYWAVPSSWLSSAALGYLDGAYAPILLVAAVAAAYGRAGAAGAALAAAALIKPTALVASPALAVALRTPRRIGIATVAGIAVVAAVLLPFALDGTAGAAIAQVRKILSQERLSAGYANPWWIAGAVVTGQYSHVPVLRLDAVPFPARAIGLCALAAAVALVARALARERTTPRTVVACASLFAAYAVLATSVHTNHPHPLALLLVAALCVGAVPRAPALLLVLGYAVNILFDEGLGRVAGPRYGVLERADPWLDALRFGAGVDLTLPLAVVHTLAFGLLRRALTRPTSRPQVAETDWLPDT